MIPIPFRVYIDGAVLLAMFMAGWTLGSRHTQREWDRERAQETAAISKQLAENAQSLEQQRDRADKAEAHGNDIQRAWDADRVDWTRRVRDYEVRLHTLPSAPQSAPQSDAAPKEPSQPDRFAEALGRVAADCTADSRQLQALEDWVRGEGMASAVR